mmetsp:Transcript_57217/g.51517  ORF Transcript_57217/g.51517 Transcript_57217/m.51517 type:complete len:206 (+) Transcript_57217:91-708(+)
MTYATKKGMSQAKLLVETGQIRFRNMDSSKEIKIGSYHISCKSDPIGNKKMMGIILYQNGNESGIFYVGKLKCRPGYILLIESWKIIEIKKENETMHAATFRYFTGLDIKKTNIIAGGFSIQNNELVDRSGTCNAPTNNFGLFHDKNRCMNNVEKFVLETAVTNWQLRKQQNTEVSTIVKVLKEIGVIKEIQKDKFEFQFLDVIN